MAFSSKFGKIQRSLHKTDPRRTLNRLRSTKPKNFGIKRVTTRRHRLVMTNGLVPQNCANLPTISENGRHQEIQRAPIYKTPKIQAQTMSHAPPRAARRFGIHSFQSTLFHTLQTISRAYTRWLFSRTRKRTTRAIRVSASAA